MKAGNKCSNKGNHTSATLSSSSSSGPGEYTGFAWFDRFMDGTGLIRCTADGAGAEEDEDDDSVADV